MTAIWLVPSSYAPSIGGVEEHTARVAAGLRSRGHDVTVVVNQWPADLPVSESLGGVQVQRLPFSQPGQHPLRMLRHVRSIPRLQRALDAVPRPDIVHVHCMAAQTGHITRWTRRHDVPLVLSTHGETAMDSHRAYDRDPFQRYSLRAASKQASAMTACSGWTRVHTACYAARFADAMVIHNGVDTKEFDGLSDVTSPVFAAYGRQVHEKGFDRLLDVMPEVRRRLPGARLLIAGDGPESASITAALGPHDEHRGRLDRTGVRQILADARTVVIPSRIEPFGIVAREALAAGRQLVYSRTGGLSEAAGRFGLAVDAGNPTALVDAMVAAHRGGGELPGPETLLDWSWERVVETYEHLYDGVINKKSLPGARHPDA